VTVKQSDPIEPLVFIEEWMPDLGAATGSWRRMTRFGVALHPAYGASLLKDLRKIHKSRKFRLVEQPNDDIPF
jgi:hypothetical protein